MAVRCTATGSGAAVEVHRDRTALGTASSRALRPAPRASLASDGGTRRGRPLTADYRHRQSREVRSNGRAIAPHPRSPRRNGVAVAGLPLRNLCEGASR
jgi:hypothetical protein